MTESSEWPGGGKDLACDAIGGKDAPCVFAREGADGLIVNGMEPVLAALRREDAVCIVEVRKLDVGHEEGAAKIHQRWGEPHMVGMEVRHDKAGYVRGDHASRGERLVKERHRACPAGIDKQSMANQVASGTTERKHQDIRL